MPGPLVAHPWQHHEADSRQREGRGPQLPVLARHRRGRCTPQSLAQVNCQHLLPGANQCREHLHGVGDVDAVADCMNEWASKCRQYCRYDRHEVLALFLMQSYPLCGHCPLVHGGQLTL